MFINIKNLTKDNFLNFFILSLPVSIIIGNSAVNINVVLICLIGLAIYGFRIFKIHQDIVACLLSIFFLYLILITLINNVPNIGVDNTSTENIPEYLTSGLIKSGYIQFQNSGTLYKEHIFKSFFFLRFLILFLVINKFTENKKLNFKFFFIISATLAFLVAVDDFVLSAVNKNFIEQSFFKHFTGVFGDEGIAGGYIQKFSLFFIFFIVMFLPISKTNKIIFTLGSVIFFFVSIIFTDNRMPLLLYLSSILFFMVIDKRFRKYSMLVLLLFSMIMVIFFKFFPNSKPTHRLASFTGSVYQIFKVAPKLFYHGKVNSIGKSNPQGIDFASGHLVTFNSGVQIWKENKVFGGGLKSFRINCKMDYKFQVCNTHPHNYLIEILVDAGLVGFIIIYMAFAIVIINFFKSYKNDFKSNLRFIAIPFFLILSFEIFPLRSTGSFFSTSNAVLIFLTLAVINNYYKNNIFTK